MTAVISLYGGPGTGKSTSAAYLFALLKQRGYNAELVREYVKDWAYDERKPGVFDQYYFMGKQLRKESMLLGKVDYIVTDSPLWIGAFYAHHYGPPTVELGVLAAVSSYYEQCSLMGHKHVHVWLRRSKEYNPNGRYQTEQQARELDEKQHDFIWSRAGGNLKYCETDFNELTALLERL